MEVLKIIVSIVIGYLIGSIPFALVIGKGFFDRDIRDGGSHNLGGTNAGRLLGKTVGISVIFLDAAKVFLAVLIVSSFKSDTAMILAGLAACFGHCYPVFAQFKGGKAVASAYGYLLAIAILVTSNPLTLIVPLLVFILFLGLFRMVSLGSMVGILAAVIFNFIFTDILALKVSLVLLLALVVYRHLANIKRIIAGKESKISWLK